jgi:hydrogenase nickel incorporation protein HypA/HybF
MHEFAITRSLLDQVLAEARGRKGRTKSAGPLRGRITRIKIRIGESAGVVPDCVQFYFDRMKQGTAAEGARLEFERVRLRLKCPKCGAEFDGVEDMCGCNAGAEVVSGQDMVLESIELEEGAE